MSIDAPPSFNPSDGAPLDVVQPETIPNMSTALIVKELRKIHAALGELNGRAEAPAPALLRLPIQGHIKARILTWHLHPLLVGNYALRVGSENKSSIGVTATQTGGCIPEPLPITIDRGLTVQVIDLATGVQATGAQILDSFLLGYTE